MMAKGSYVHPKLARTPEIVEDPVRKEISKMIDCIHAANYATAENSAEEAGYSKERYENGINAVTIRVVEYFSVEKTVFLGLFKQDTQKMRVICIIRYEGSGWKMHDTEIFNTEKVADLFRHFKYYNLNVVFDGISEEYLNALYIEARKARRGVIDHPKQ